MIQSVHQSPQVVPEPGCSLAVVIPCYRVASQIAAVIARMPPQVDHIIVVDDASPDNLREVLEKISDPRLLVLQHPINRGVGGAMKTGFAKALELKAEIVVKVDGDGQMDPSQIGRLIAPILNHQADYAKGARFFETQELRRMPLTRLLGNLGLSFAAKLVSGYWNLLDPANGYVAIHRQVLERMPLQTLSRDFFFETDMLIQLYYIQAVIADVHLPAHYGDEHSNLSPLKILLNFPGKLFKALCARILWRYFVQDFTVCSLFLVFGLLLFLGGASFGAVMWIHNGLQGAITTPGTVMLAVVPLLLGFQLLLQALVLDIQNVPKLPIHTNRRIP